MGLDISAYSNLRYTGLTHYDRDEDHDDNDYIFVNNDAFPERLGGMEEGFYEETNSTEHHGFRAGSYSGYNYWRSALCRAVLRVEPDVLWENPDAYKGRPFFELINMSDCEGTIGTEVCKKLYDDFVQYAAEVDAMEADDQYKRSAEWQEAFRLGSQNGIVEFH